MKAGKIIDALANTRAIIRDDVAYFCELITESETISNTIAFLIVPPGMSEIAKIVAGNSIV